MPPVPPMLARPVADIPPGQLYEPKWDGFRSIVFRDGDEVVIGSRNERPMTRYFPELVAAFRAHLPERCVVDGEIVVADPGGDGLDFFALQQRIHPADSRVRMLAEKTPAAFVAFDLLALDDDDLTAVPFADRRARLEAAVGPAPPPIHVTPITGDEAVAARWFDLFEGAGLDGLIAKRPDLLYLPDKRVMSKIKHVRTADCVVAGYRVYKRSKDAVGSLLLGLYDDPDDEGTQVPEIMRGGAEGPALVSVGVVGAFPMAQRRELMVDLAPLVVPIEDHPWNWGEIFGDAAEHGRPSGHRWNSQHDWSFVPLRPERVVEVRYDSMEGFRFRHTAQFVRWRPDRDPESCTYAQLERPVHYDLGAVLAGDVTPTSG
jgi:ATP-dependent DNA ligase